MLNTVYLRGGSRESVFIKQFNLSSAGTVQRGIKSLLNKGIIDKNGESIEINDVFLKLWLIKKMSYSIKQNF